MTRPPHPAWRGLWREAGTADALAGATESAHSRIAPLLADPVAAIADPADFADLLGPAQGDALLDATLRRLQGDAGQPVAPAPRHAHRAAPIPRPVPRQRVAAVATGTRAAEPAPGLAGPPPPPNHTSPNHTSPNHTPAARIEVAAMDRADVGAEILRAAAHQVVAGRSSLPDAARVALRRLFAEAAFSPTPRPAPVARIAEQPAPTAVTPSPVQADHAVSARGLSLLPRLVARAAQRASPTPADRHTPAPDLAADPPAAPSRIATITGFRGLAARAAARSSPTVQPSARQPGLVGNGSPTDTWAMPSALPAALPTALPAAAATPRADTPILPVPRPAPPATDPDIAETLARVLRQEARRQGIRVGEAS